MNIEFHRTFKKKYKRASVKIRQQFDERLLLFDQNPFHPMLNNHPLGGDRAGQWSINVTGDLRAVYIFHGKNTSVFIDIDTHSNLYE